MSRGPKVKTSRNSPPGAHQRIEHAVVEPTSPLNEDATKEFWRLVEVMESRGCLDRVDLSVITNAARTKDLLDRANAGLDNVVGADYFKQIAAINSLQGQLRGLTRELALTIKPSTTLVRSDAKKPAQAAEAIAGKIKIAE
jgi:hypothetical protein